MRNAALAVVCISTPLFLAACSSSPPGSNPAVSEARIVASVLKELYCSIGSLQGALPQAENWVAAFDLSLKTDVDGTVAPEITLLGPFSPGTYAVAAGAGFDQTATALRTNKFFILLNRLRQFYQGFDCQTPNEGRYLEGPLGIEPWLRNTIAAQDEVRKVQGLGPQDSNHVVPDDPPLTIGATFTFRIKGSAHFGPSFVLPRVKAGSSDLFSAARTETNSVDIALTPSTLGVAVEYVPNPAAVRAAENYRRAASEASESNLAVQELEKQMQIQSADPSARAVQQKLKDEAAAKAERAQRNLDRALIEIKRTPAMRQIQREVLSPSTAERLNQMLLQLQLRTLLPRRE